MKFSKKRHYEVLSKYIELGEHVRDRCPYILSPCGDRNYDNCKGCLEFVGLYDEDPIKVCPCRVLGWKEAVRISKIALERERNYVLATSDQLS